MVEHRPQQPNPMTGLSARLLLLTVVFVMFAEMFIWAPSVARYRQNYLQEKIVQAHLATLAYDLVKGRKAINNLREQLLSDTDTYGIAFRQGDKRRLIQAMEREMPLSVDKTFDLRDSTFFGLIGDAFDVLAQAGNRVIRVIGVPPQAPDNEIEIVIDETSMRDRMVEFSGRILSLSLGISFFTAGLLYLSLQWLMVGPMRRMISSMAGFRAAPEDETRALEHSARSDEIGVAFRELNHMQTELRNALRQKNRLATLGAAVAKVNHDLRNTLATAVLASDKLAASEDPEVRRVTPQLYRAIDRAVNLCGQTLNYVSDTAPALSLSAFPVADLLNDVGDAVTAMDAAPEDFGWIVEEAGDLEILADQEQLFRVIMNLGINSIQAGATRVTARARAGADETYPRFVIDILDNGPGLPQRTKDKLFQPFAGSAREGGTGLGLVIARDILKAHGGDLRLLKSDGEGTAFCLELPNRVIGDDSRPASAA